MGVRTATPIKNRCEGDLVFSDCHSSCAPVCGEEKDFCIAVCVEGCGCPGDLFRSFQNSTTCVQRDECQGNSCHMTSIEEIGDMFYK